MAPALSGTDDRYSARRGFARLVLATTERNVAARTLYERAGFDKVREEIAQGTSSKTVGAGVRRFHYEKALCPVERTDDL